MVSVGSQVCGRPHARQVCDPHAVTCGARPSHFQISALVVMEVEGPSPQSCFVSPRGKPVRWGNTFQIPPDGAEEKWASSGIEQTFSRPDTKQKLKPVLTFDGTGIMLAMLTRQGTSNKKNAAERAGCRPGRSHQAKEKAAAELERCKEPCFRAACVWLGFSDCSQEGSGDVKGLWAEMCLLRSSVFKVVLVAPWVLHLERGDLAAWAGEQGVPE